jgi:hypothetical protein
LTTTTHPVDCNQWYVSTTGSSTNAGTLGSPWSLSYAAGGAGGRIVPGDTVWVCGGTYSSQTGFKITVSGTATNKVTFKQYTGETVILDGSIAEFTTIGNTAWEPYDQYRTELMMANLTERSKYIIMAGI